MPTIKGYQSLTCHIDGRKQTSIIMTYISEKEERQLDKGNTIQIHRDNLTFILGNSNVFYYGNIDFNTGSDDYEKLYDAFYDYDYYTIPLDYDYIEHVCRSPTKMYRTIESNDFAKLAQYRHGVLGKPEKVVIFRYIKE